MRTRATATACLPLNQSEAVDFSQGGRFCYFQTTLISKSSSQQSYSGRLQRVGAVNNALFAAGRHSATGAQREAIGVQAQCT